MTNESLVETLFKLLEVNTVYVNGGFGTTLKGSQLDRYTSKGYNKENEAKIRQAASQPPCYGFDCIGMVKGLLWGFSFKPDATYGGAVYQSNNIKDVTISSFVKQYCDNVGKTSDASKYPIGSFVYRDDHCGVYVGEGAVVHCSRNGSGKVQLGKVTDFDGIARIKSIEYVEKPSPEKPSIVCPCCGARFSLV